MSVPLSASSPSLRRSLVASLCHLAYASKDAEVAKRAVHALTSRLLVPTVREKTLEALLAKLTPMAAPSQKAGPAQHAALAALAALAKREPAALGASRGVLLGKMLEAAVPAVPAVSLQGVERRTTGRCRGGERPAAVRTRRRRSR